MSLIRCLPHAFQLLRRDTVPTLTCYGVFTVQ